ncbi:MAG: hypothetical protein GTO63_11395, partial [Anaerolineae bacterium]|nr:hypothetical protein [Anaerolineae bacterium]
RAPDETCIAEMPGPVFDLPREPGASEVVLELFVDELTGLWGLVPEGWAEEYPLNFERGETSLDPTRLVLDATWRSKGELFIVLSSWLGFDAGTKSVGSGEVGNFTWDFYELRVERYPADLALAEHGGKSYFVLLVSPADEREALYDSVFLPVVEALAPLE